MEYQLKLLKIFNNEGFEKIVDMIDELMSDSDKLLLLFNFLILNINNNNINNNTNLSNIKYLCNYLKNDLVLYNDLIQKIINNNNIQLINKEFFLLNILNTYNSSNNNIVNDNCIKIIYENLKYNNEIINHSKTDNLNNIILYKILNVSIYTDEIYTSVTYDEINLYYKNILDKLFTISENILLEFFYNLCNIYNYRCKTYSNKDLNDNILYVIINYIYNKCSFKNNDLIIHYIEKNIDLNNIIFNEIKTYEKSIIYEILLLKYIHITIQYSISEIEHNNTVIYEHNNIIEKINNNELLQTFEIIQNYIVTNNDKKIKKYESYNNILYNKLNKNLLVNIYEYYVELIIKLSNNNITTNNECFTTIITNIINFYVFYTKKHTYIYNNLEEKYNCIGYLSNVFGTDLSNINLDIQLVDFFKTVLLNESTNLINKPDTDLNILISKSFVFYSKLDTYEDYYKYNIKYNIINLYTSLFYIKYDIDILNDNINKFLISFIEDINVNISYFIIYYKLYLINKDYSYLAQTYYIYLEKFLRFYKNLISKHIDNIDLTIIEIAIHKLNYNIVKLNNICIDKNNVYKIILYIIDIYLLHNNSKYLQIIKNDTIFFNYDTFIELANNLYSIYKSSNIILFQNLIEEVNNCNINIDDYNNIPEEFLDPLYNTLIETPVLLPSSKQCVDYDVIKKHLLYHSFDPFNREHLTLEILDNFNNEITIKEKMDIFKKKIELWKLTAK